MGLKLPGLIYTKDGVSTGFWTGAGWCIVFVLLDIALSALTYYTVELPCRKWINAKWGKPFKTAVITGGRIIVDAFGLVASSCDKMADEFCTCLYLFANNLKPSIAKVRA